MWPSGSNKCNCWCCHLDWSNNIQRLKKIFLPFPNLPSFDISNWQLLRNTFKNLFSIWQTVESFAIIFSRGKVGKSGRRNYSWDQDHTQTKLWWRQINKEYISQPRRKTGWMGARFICCHHFDLELNIEHPQKFSLKDLRLATWACICCCLKLS